MEAAARKCEDLALEYRAGKNPHIATALLKAAAKIREKPPSD